MIINDVKTLLDINDNSQDTLLLTLVNNAEDMIRDYTHDPHLDIPAITIQIVMYLYNRRGTEGLASESYSGTTFTYKDLPEFIQAQLNGHRKARFY